MGMAGPNAPDRPLAGVLHGATRNGCDGEHAKAVAGSGPAAHLAPRLLMPAGQRRVPPSGAILPTRRSRCRLSAAGAEGAHETTDSVDGVRARRLDEEDLPILPEHGNPDRMRHLLIEISVRPEGTVSRFGSRKRHEIEHDPELTAGESPDLGLTRWIETR